MYLTDKNVAQSKVHSRARPEKKASGKMQKTREEVSQRDLDSLGPLIWGDLTPRQAALLYWHATRPRWMRRMIWVMMRLRMTGLIVAYYRRWIEPPELKFCETDLTDEDRQIIAWVRSLGRWQRTILVLAARVGMGAFVYWCYGSFKRGQE